MPDSKGIVESINKEGNASVVILSVGPQIPGAHRLEACHCPTASSTVKINSLNRAGAAVGDLVLVSRKPGAIFRNVVALLGIPLAGLFMGAVFTMYLFYEFASYVTGTILGLFCLTTGIVIGVSIYRRIWTDNQPIVSRVIQPGFKDSLSFKSMCQYNGKNDGTYCNMCTGK